ncbi:MAG: hypothetical protein ACEY3H_03615, partial [Wolbachia sp.]
MKAISRLLASLPKPQLSFSRNEKTYLTNSASPLIMKLKLFYLTSQSLQQIKMTRKLVFGVLL